MFLLKSYIFFILNTSNYIFVTLNYQFFINYLIFQAKYMYRTDFNYKLKYLNFLNCNKTTFVSSFEDFNKTLNLYLIIVKNKHVNFKKVFQNSSKLYKSYVNDFNKIDQNDQISLLFMNNKLFLNAAVFFVCLTSLLIIKLPFHYKIAFLLLLITFFSFLYNILYSIKIL